MTNQESKPEEWEEELAETVECLSPVPRRAFNDLKSFISQLLEKERQSPLFNKSGCNCAETETGCNCFLTCWCHKREDKLEKAIEQADVEDYVEEEVYCRWFKCLSCGYTMIEEGSNFCPGCGRSVVLALKKALKK